MSTNDFSIDQLELLNISQHNLNMNSQIDITPLEAYEMIETTTK